MKILNFGSLNIDHVYSVSHFVKPGETLSSQTYEIFSGGKGLNQSIGLAKAGAEIYHAGKIGGDGMFLIEMLKKVEVDYENITISDIATGHAIIQVNAEGENSIILYGGANQAINKDEVDTVFKKFQAGDTLLLQNEISQAAYIMQTAKKKKMTIIFNPAPMSPKVQDLPLDVVDIFILNELEGEELSGIREPKKMLLALKKRFPRALSILTLGSKGAQFLRGNETVTVPAHKVDVVDTTAAGDTFIAYFTEAYTKGSGIKTAIQKANKAAALSVTIKGAANSIPFAMDL